MQVKRIYTQKKPGFDIESKQLLEDLKESLKIENLEDVVLLNRYDVMGISDEVLDKAKHTIFSEPQVELCFEEEYVFEKSDAVFAVEYLPGQFDQREYSLSECLRVANRGR